MANIRSVDLGDYIKGLIDETLGAAKSKQEINRQKGREESDMKKEILSVPNISCGHCVMSIKNELGELEGIHRVEGDPVAKAITVEWDTPATLEKIKDTLKEINFPAL